MKHYKFLEQVFSRINNIDDTIRLLECSTMDLDSKIERINTLQEIRYEIITDDMIDEMINFSLNNKKKLNDWELANLNHMHRAYQHNKNVPVNLIKDLFKAKVNCGQQWELFRNKNSSLKDVMGNLSEVVKLVSDMSSIRSTSLKMNNKYDAVLSMYDADLSEKKIDEVFTDIGAFLRQFVHEAIEKQNHSRVYYAKSVDEDKQKAFGNYCLSLFGIQNDVIFTKASCNNYVVKEKYEFIVRYDELNYKCGIENLLKNIGYFLYELNLPKQWANQLVGRYSGSIMYEAQGMLMSCHLMHDKGFINYIAPSVKKFLSLRGKVSSCENIYSYFTRIQPSTLFDESDEVTFLAHVMLRYTLEKEMINDDLQVKDLPDAWFQGIKYYFNLTSNDDFDQLMQDGYWINGLFGYIPCMAISAIVAAQIFDTIKKCDTEILEEVSKGNFKNLFIWLSKNLHSYGAKYNSMALLQKVTKQSLNVDFYKNYLINKYLNI
ncbi:gluzincin family metallopeptidase [Candidatus Neoehrlichia procyonis]|uniref:Metal-dependent carboxypeptidase n=1 Tax=Candidatus Neoehrlichia procyonis str. RAC413 TaxID=1359163 RepID=A0A0F3NQ24_9RICK|nr:hypothetical protein [Candidatus Neoehrlichia lotoris]KJV69014.1 carboxypeptidase Taq (M32) metallopeptidase family protein [Candidatus Neoehrlichia lotoris str. RAC413]